MYTGECVTQGGLPSPSLKCGAKRLCGLCREAARKASAYAEDGTFMENKEPLRLPAFEKVIGFAVQKALEDWRDEALEGEMLLSFVTPSCLQSACLPSASYICAVSGSGQGGGGGF